MLTQTRISNNPNVRAAPPKPPPAAGVWTVRAHSARARCAGDLRRGRRAHRARGRRPALTCLPAPGPAARGRDGARGGGARGGRRVGGGARGRRRRRRRRPRTPPGGGAAEPPRPLVGGGRRRRRRGARRGVVLGVDGGGHETLVPAARGALSFAERVWVAPEGRQWGQLHSEWATTPKATQLGRWT